MKRTIAILATLAALAAPAMATPITYTVFGRIFPTVANPEDTGNLAGHITMNDGSATGTAELFWTGQPDPLTFDFSLAANLPGPPDQRFYSSADNDSIMTLADWEGGAAAIFSPEGWSSDAGVNGWDLWTVSVGTAGIADELRSASISRVLEGVIPVTEPATSALAVFAALGILVVARASNHA